eukprot:c19162_g1_i8 orf=349-918(-)
MKEMVEGKAAIQSDLHFTYSSSSMDSVRPLEALPNGIKKGVATRHSDCSWLLQQRIKGFVKVLVVGLLQGRLPVIPISKYQIRDFSCQGNENESSVYEKSANEELLIIHKKGGAQRLITMLRVIQIVQQLLSENKHASKRDVYYTDPLIFQDPAAVDRAINDICIHFQCNRNALNVGTDSFNAEQRNKI